MKIINICFELQTRWVNFRVSDSNLKYIKLHFELLTRSQLISGTQFYPCFIPIKYHQQETSLSFWSLAKLSYPYIKISYYLYLYSLREVAIYCKTWSSKLNFLFPYVENIDCQIRRWLIECCLLHSFLKWKLLMESVQHRKTIGLQLLNGLL